MIIIRVIFIVDTISIGQLFTFLIENLDIGLLSPCDNND